MAKQMRFRETAQEQTDETAGQGVLASGAKRRLVRLLMICLFLEALLFQWPFFASLVSAGAPLLPEITVSAGLSETPAEGGTGTYYTVTDPSDASILLAFSPAAVRNLALSATLSSAGGQTAPLTFHAEVTDASHAYPYALPARTLPATQARGIYRLHLSNPCTGIRIVFDREADGGATALSEGAVIGLSEIALNARVPYRLRPLRFLTLLTVGLLWLLFRPGSALYLQKASLSHPLHRVLIGAELLTLLIAVSACVFVSRPDRNWDRWGRHEKQYEEQTQAFLQGQIPLLYEAPAFLREMDNPYDYEARYVRAAEEGSYTLIDTAYYDGRYYMYFGVVPVLLTFFPVALIMGRIVKTWMVVWLYALFCVPVMMAFVWALCRRVLKNGFSIGVYLLLAGTLPFAAGVTYLAAFPVTYSLPSLAGLLFALAGLTLWLLARTPEGKLRPVFLAGGAFLCALTLGCRVPMILSSLLAFPIFAEEIRTGLFFRKDKESLLRTGCMILPFVLVCVPLLWYNALRFDAPLSFGHAYLLTVTDGLHGNRDLSRALPALFAHLVQPMRITGAFPFVRETGFAHAYAGQIYAEPLAGGYFAFHPFALLALLSPLLLQRAHKARALSQEASVTSLTAPLVAVTALCLSAVLAFADAMSAGVSQRYQYDFGFLLSTAAMIVFCQVLQKTHETRWQKALYAAAALCLFWCVAAHVLTLFSDARYFAMAAENPDWYYAVRQWFYL